VDILITGASGLLGAHLLSSLSTKHTVVGVDRQPWWGDTALPVLRGDLRDEQFLADVRARVKPDVVIHCAAMLDVEQCERDPGGAFAMNARLPGILARSLPRECLFVYVSTDSLFGGNEWFATEASPAAPRTIYAQSKRAGEQEVEAATDNHLIIRTCFYGWSSGRKKTYGEWLYDVLARQQPVTLFTDVFFTPIYVMDLAERIALLMEGGHRGYFHVAGKDRVSKCGFGELLARRAGLSMAHVISGSIDASPLRAPRPKDMSLSSDRFRTCTGVEVPNCLAGITRFLRDRGTELSARCVSLQALTSEASMIPERGTP